MKLESFDIVSAPELSGCGFVSQSLGALGWSLLLQIHQVGSTRATEPTVHRVRGPACGTYLRLRGQYVSAPGTGLVAWWAVTGTAWALHHPFFCDTGHQAPRS